VTTAIDGRSRARHARGRIIGAVGHNRIGVSGVCWRASLMAIKAFDERARPLWRVVAALRYAVDNGAGSSTPVGVTVKEPCLAGRRHGNWAAGVLIVAAAGNERSDVAHSPPHTSRPWPSRVNAKANARSSRTSAPSWTWRHRGGILATMAERA